MTPADDPELLARARAALATGADDALLAQLLVAARGGGAGVELRHHLATQLLRRGRTGAAARWFLTTPLDLSLGQGFVMARAQALIAARQHAALERCAAELAAAGHRSFAAGLNAQVALAEQRVDAALALLHHGPGDGPRELHLALLEAQCLARLGRDTELRQLIESLAGTLREARQTQLEQHVWTIVRQTEFAGHLCARDRLYVREGVVLLGSTGDDGEHIELSAEVRLDVRAIARTAFRFQRLQQALEWPLLSLEPANDRSRPLAVALGQALGVPVRRPLSGQLPSSAWWVQDLADEQHPLPPPTGRPRWALIVAGEPLGEPALPEVVGLVAAGMVSLPWDRPSRTTVSPLLVHLAPDAVRSEPGMGAEQFVAAFAAAFARLVPEPNEAAQIDYYLRRHRQLRERIAPGRNAAPPQPSPAASNPLLLLAEDEPVPLLGALRHLWRQREISVPVLERLSRLFERDPQLRPALLPLLERFAPARALALVSALPADPEVPGPTRGDLLAALRSTAVLPELRADLLRQPMATRVGVAFPDFRLGAFLHRDELPELLDQLTARPGGITTALAFAAGLPQREAPGLAARIRAWTHATLTQPAPAEQVSAALAACLGGWTTLDSAEAATLLAHPAPEVRDRALRLLARGQAPELLPQARELVRSGAQAWSPGAALVLLAAPADRAAFVAQVRQHGLPPLNAGEGSYLATLPDDGQRDTLLSELSADTLHDEVVTALLLPLLGQEPMSQFLVRWLPATLPYLPAEALSAAVRLLLVHGCDSAEENSFLRGMMQVQAPARFEAAALLLARGDSRFREPLTWRPAGGPPEEGPGPECLAYLPPAELDILGETLLQPLQAPGGELLTQRVLGALAEPTAFESRLLNAIVAGGLRQRVLDHLAAFYLADEAPPFPEGMIATFGLRDGMQSPSLRTFFRLDPALARRAARQRFAATTSLEREVILRTCWHCDRALYDELAGQVAPGQDRVLDCLRRSLLLPDVAGA